MNKLSDGATKFDYANQRFATSLNKMYVSGKRAVPSVC